MKNLRGLERTAIGSQDTRIVMDSEPFFSHISQRRIPPDKDSLLVGWQEAMGTACDGKADTGRRSFGRASL